MDFGKYIDRDILDKWEFENHTFISGYCPS